MFSTNIPSISFSFGIDPLSSFFLMVILSISLLIGIYGIGYLKHHRHLAWSSPFFPLVIASMLGVVTSRDGFSFIIVWEIMSLASFFLITTEHENKDIQRAGWIYLIATHMATAFLMVFFAVLAKQNGSFLFSFFTSNPMQTSLTAGIIFMLAVTGFGAKAGIFPLHAWLPHADPAAPNYISAILSGIVIKMGIYGIMRALTFFQAPPVWWGGSLIVIGIASAILGVLYALMQHDLKKLLAYHSVENIGIIIIGLGIGLIGVSLNNELAILLGFSGALFHVLNHAIFKSLLFLCAGSLMSATHSLSIDRLGGLIKKLPLTATIFMIASISICGLPPLNGFISEWLVYMGLFGTSQSSSGYALILSFSGILGIAFAGGLAVICFTKVLGVVFLGEPRNDIIDRCKEPSRFMLCPMIILATSCILLGIFPTIVMPKIVSTVEFIFPQTISADLGKVLFSLNQISVIFIVLIATTAMFWLIRKLAFRKKELNETVTWDCGYAHPKASMQYTACSFAEPIKTFFKGLLRPEVKMDTLSGVFPGKSNFEEHVYDYAEKNIFNPLFQGIGSAIKFIRMQKKSTVQSYLVLIFITLIALFILEVWIGI
jgi:formate hydrogenlyase subunit 3/multisubunit Na+/H+ antiporter MnhD subunit